MRGQRIALVIRSLEGGGMQRCMLELGESFVAQGCEVRLCVGDPRGPMRNRIAAGMTLVPLSRRSGVAARLAALRLLGRHALPLLGVSAPRMLGHLEALARELAEFRPQAVLSMGTQSNLTALWARHLARADSRVVLCECTTLSVAAVKSARRFRRSYPALIKRYYLGADAIVAVSQAVAADLAETADLPPASITAIPNWVTTEVTAPSGEAAMPPWPEVGDDPLILAVGRLHWQKDFGTLLRAFALLRRSRPVKLAFLGDGPERSLLEKLTAELGLSDSVRFVGFVKDPFTWMRRASVLAVTSLSEGFGNVIVEALACGLPVVSTDCAGGPREILAGGAFGRLTPVGDANALARALDQTLRERPDKSALKRRAADFSLAAASERYLNLLLGSSLDAP